MSNAADYVIMILHILIGIGLIYFGRLAITRKSLTKLKIKTFGLILLISGLFITIYQIIKFIVDIIGKNKDSAMVTTVTETTNEDGSTTIITTIEEVEDEEKDKKNNKGGQGVGEETGKGKGLTKETFGLMSFFT